MKLEELKEQLEAMSDKELFRYLRKLICESLAEQGESGVNGTLDIVFSECQKRGKERLYDKTYETICNNPDVCQAVKVS